MNAPTPLRNLGRPAALAAPPTAAEHFRLALFGVVLQLIDAGAAADRSAAIAAHPFLADYIDTIGAQLQVGEFEAADWHAAVALWESGVAAPGVALPLVALRAAGLEALDVELLLAVGLLEEDPRFGDLFEAATGCRRPTLGLLQAWWRSAPDGDDRIESVRHSALGLIHRGLVSVTDLDAPRSMWMLAVVPAFWDALRGGVPSLPWLSHTACSALLPIERFVAPAACASQCTGLPTLLAASPAPLLVLRGPAHNGRKTLLGAAARALGKGLLVTDTRALDTAAQWNLFGALAAVLDALPVLELPLAAGENRVLPKLPLTSGALAVVTGLQGGIQCGDARPALSLVLGLPGPVERRSHWQEAAPDQRPDTLDTLATGARLSSGNIRRAANAAAGYARLAGRHAIGLDDVRLASRGLQGARLETVAARLDARGTLADLALDAATRDELDLLCLRCRHRETLTGDGGDTPTPGVRALFDGPSGTGKTYAARLLAATLGKDVYRIDLSATVNKFLGETEKNLEAALGAAEELDVVLLLDEGDSLMARRTDVGSSNDRYANLETNFLLQRIESFGGILVVTTNAADRIDKAFARRMDVVVAFRAPDEMRRYEILRMMLGLAFPDDAFLQDVAWRCSLTGGQLRNVVTHAHLLALAAGHAPAAPELHQALLREYRKTGGHCPLKHPAAAGAGA